MIFKWTRKDAPPEKFKGRWGFGDHSGNDEKLPTGQTATGRSGQFIEWAHDGQLK
jgi:hypothetical protein